MSQHFEASFGAIGKLACLFLPAASQGRRVAKPATAPLTSNWSTSTVFLNFGCSTTARYLKSSDRSFALSQSTFWPWFRSREPIEIPPSSLRTQGPIRRRLSAARRSQLPLLQLAPVVMGPCVRRDDIVTRSSRHGHVDGSSLLHAQRDEAQFAFAVRDQEQHRLLAVLLELIDALLDVGGVSDGFLRHLDDDVAGGEPLFGGVGIAINTGDDHALDAVLDLVLRAQVFAQRSEIEAERLLRHGFFDGVFLGLGG